jgi:hypothetical protein
MTQKDTLTKCEEEDFAAPEWLIQKLQLAGDYQAFTSDDQPALSEQFRARVREIMIKETLDKLRAERERIGFWPVPIGAYIQGMAKAANLSLPLTLGWFGISDIHNPNPQSARGFARLGLKLGLSLFETLAHIRIAIAGSVGDFPFNLSYRDGGLGQNDLQKCLFLLREIEAKYDQLILDDLRLIEDEVRAVYQQESQ